VPSGNVCAGSISTHEAFEQFIGRVFRQGVRLEVADGAPSSLLVILAPNSSHVEAINPVGVSPDSRLTTTSPVYGASDIPMDFSSPRPLCFQS